MAQAPKAPSQLAGFGVMGAKLALKAAIMVVMNNAAIVEHVAGVMYWNELGKEFAKAGDQRQLWITRARSALQGLSETVGG